MALIKILLVSVIALVVINSHSLGCQSMNGISRKAVLLGLKPDPKKESESNSHPAVKVNGKDPEQSVLPNTNTNGNIKIRNQSEASDKRFNSVFKSNHKIHSDPLSEPNKNLPVFLETNTNKTTRGKLIDLNVTFDVLRKTLETLEEIHNHTRIYNISSEPRPFNWSQADETETTEDRNTIRWFYPKPRNVSKPIIIQSLTKSNEYIGFKFINISSDVPNENFTLTTSKFLDESVELVEDENPGALFMRILKFPVDPSTRKNPNDTLTEQLAAELLQQPVTVGDEDDDLIDPEEDKKVNTDWGGSCGVEHWKSCYNITVMGSPTERHPRFPDDRKKNIKTQLDCFDTMEAKYFPWLCLRNGWTVNRCHILCMSKCNRDLLYTRKWEFFVLHEGACKTK